MKKAVAAIRISPTDTVALITERVFPGDQVMVDDLLLEARSEIPFGHKIAVKDMEQGQAVIKYGQKIGTAAERIACGEYVHVHNIIGHRGTTGKRGQ